MSKKSSRIESADDLVLDYLVKKGYKNAEHVLREELRATNIVDYANKVLQENQIHTNLVNFENLVYNTPVDPHVTSTSSSASSTSSANNASVAPAASGASSASAGSSGAGNSSAASSSASHGGSGASNVSGAANSSIVSLLGSRYHLQFATLCDWAHNSLEIYRTELNTILYPLYIHVYLELVHKGLGEDAQIFLAKHRMEFDALHAAEIKQISGVLTADHIKELPLAQTWLQHRYSVQLCSFAFELLLMFLHEANFQLVLQILNKHFNMSVYPGPPSASRPAHVDGLFNLKEGGQSINSKPYYFGLFGGQRENFGFVSPSDIAPNPNRMDLDPTATSVVGGVQVKDPSMSRVELPKVPNDRMTTYFEDRKKRFPVSVAAMPSACCFTFLQTFESLTALTINSDASLVCAAFSDSTVRVWDVKKVAANSAKQNAVSAGTAPSAPLGFGGGPGASVPASAGSGNNSLYLRANQSDFDTLVGNSAAVYGISIAPDSKFVLTGGGDTTLRMFALDVQGAYTARSPNAAANATSLPSTTPCVCVYKGHQFPVWDCVFAPTGYYFASASSDRTARLWCTDRVQCLRIWAGHMADVNVVRFHPNGNYIATGSTDKSVRLWDLQTGHCVRLLTDVHCQSACYSLAFSPDGQTLAAGYDDGSIVVWELGSARRFCTLKGHASTVWSLSYSYPTDNSGHASSNIGGITTASGSSASGVVGDTTYLLASGAQDRTVRLWDCNRATGSSSSSANSSGSVPSRHPLNTFYTKGTPVFYVNFSARNLLFVGGALDAKPYKHENV